MIPPNRTVSNAGTDAWATVDPLPTRRTHFGAIVVVADLASTAMCNTLRALRHAAPDSWLVLIADPMIDRAHAILHELGGDALFAAPFNGGPLRRVKINMCALRNRRDLASKNRQALRQLLNNKGWIHHAIASVIRVSSPSWLSTSALGTR